MVQWVLTVAGIAILAVICDIILPDGSTRKYIRTVIGVIVTLVMLQPIVKFVGNSVVVDTNKPEENNVQIQQSYLDMVEDKQIQSSLTTAKDVLAAHGIDIQITDLNKNNKTIALQSDVKYSAENKKLIDKTFNAYFSGYKINIEWN